MRFPVTTLVGATLALGFFTFAPAQEKPVSPHDKVEASVGGKKITIEYGRPYKKERVIFGQLVPFDKVWRLGANERTLLTLEGDVMFGALHVPAGSYSLWAAPGEKEWALVVNKQAKGWGADWDYETKIKPEEFGRATMKVSKVPLTEQLTIAIAPGAGKKGKLTITWDTTEASLELTAH